MKDRGLGDTVHRFTKATGIKSMVDRVSEGLRRLFINIDIEFEDTLTVCTMITATEVG